MVVVGNTHLERAQAVAGEIVSDVEMGALAWSNELVLHVVELKTSKNLADIDFVIVRSYLRAVGREHRAGFELPEIS